MAQEETAEAIRVEVAYRAQRGTCPRCGQQTPKVHSVRAQRKRDRRVWDKAVVVVVHKRRFRCWACGKVFSEADPAFGLRKRTSRRYREALGRAALDRPVRHVAEDEGVSEGLVRRCLTAVTREVLAALPAPGPTTVLGMDEYAVRKGQGYDTAVVDIAHRQVVGLVSGRGKAEMEACLTALPGAAAVRTVVMDLHEPFRRAVPTCLPGVAIVADKFHVLMHVHRALDQVRTSLQLRRGKRDEVFRARYLLLTGQERLTPDRFAQLLDLLDRYPRLADAWLLKEAFRSWYRLPTRREAERELVRLETILREEGPAPFRALLWMLRTWREEILNYFDGRYTNAVLEGKNNRTKVIKRVAYGYRNRDHFHQRIMLTNARRPRRTSRA